MAPASKQLNAALLGKLTASLNESKFRTSKADSNYKHAVALANQLRSSSLVTDTSTSLSQEGPNTRKAKPSSEAGIVQGSPSVQDDSEGNAWTWTLDKLSRPINAAQNVALNATNMINDWTGENPNDDWKNPLESARAGFFNEVDPSYSDVINANINPKSKLMSAGAFDIGSGNDIFDTEVAKATSEQGGLGPAVTKRTVGESVAAVGGGVADLVADPLNFVPLGWLAKGLGKGADLVTGTKKAAELRKAEIVSTEAAEKVKSADVRVGYDERLANLRDRNADIIAANADDAAAGLKLKNEADARDLMADRVDPVVEGAGARDRLADQADIAKDPWLAPKPTKSWFDRDQVADNLAAMLAGDKRTPVGFDGVESSIQASTVQQPSLFGKGDLTQIKVKNEPVVEAASATPVPPPQNGLFSLRETKQVQDIPTGWSPELKSIAGDAAAANPRKAAKLDDLATGPKVTLPRKAGETPTGLRAPETPKEVGVAAKVGNVERHATIGDQIANDLPTAAPKVIAETVPRAKATSEIRDESAQLSDLQSMAKDAHANVTEGVRTGTVNSANRENLVTDSVVKNMIDLKNIKANAGIYPVVKSGANVYHLDISDVMAALKPETVKSALGGNAATTVPAKALLAGASKVLDAAVAGLDKDAAINSVIDALKKHSGGNGMGAVRSRANLAEQLVDASPALVKALADNEYAFGIRDAVTSEKIADDVSRQVASTLDDPLAPVGDKLQTVADISGAVKEQARLHGAGPSGAIQATAKTMNDLDGVVSPTDVSMSRSTLGNSRDLAKTDVGRRPVEIDRKVKARLAIEARLAAQEALDALPPNVKLENIYDIPLNNMVQRGLQVFLTKMQYGHNTMGIANRTRNEVTAGQAEMHQFDEHLSQINKTNPPEAINAAASSFVAGTVPTDPAALKAFTEMKTLRDHLISTSDDPKTIIAETSWARNGVTWETFNKVADEKKLGFQLDPTAKGMPTNPTFADIVKQMQTWQPKDATDYLKFLSKLKSVETTIIPRQKAMQMVNDTYGSTVRKAGQVRIKAGNDFLSPYIDSTKYFDPEVARTLAAFTKSFGKQTSWAGQSGFVAGFMNKVLDPYMRIWKPLVTIVRPGHHFRNALSDSMSMGMDGYWSTKYYQDASMMAHAMGEFNGDVEGLRKMFGDKPLPAGGDRAYTVRLKNGQEAPQTYAELGKLANQTGLHLSGRISADLLEDGGAFLDKVSTKIMDTRWMKWMSKISEKESSYFRDAHWSALMRDQKFTRSFDTLEEAAHAATTRVQKYHPDVGGLTPAEAKYGRRIMPFYTFFRQIAPTIMMTLIEHPARLTALPKIQYDVQRYLGYNPASQDDPFDPEQRYPSFINENLTGPLSLMGGQFTTNLGTPVEAMNDMFKGKGLSAMTDMVNPLAQAPVELATQEQLTSGNFIPDRGEYIDRMIPGAGVASDISGYSLSGTIANALSGNKDNVYGKVGPLDPQRSRQKEEKEVLWNTSTLNFLLGLGLQNVEKPSYSKISAKELGG